MDGTSKSTEVYTSERSSGSNYIFEDPELFPRVGTEYQAEIPPLLDMCGYGQLASESYNISIKHVISNSYPMDLPIPVMWIYDKSEDKRGELKDACGNLRFENNKKGRITSDSVNGGTKTVSLLDFMENGEKSDGIQCVPSVVLSEIIGQKAHTDHWDGCYLVPGIPNEDWNGIEYSSFLLGLYIFGKNLSVVSRLIGSKQMGDILSYYYGKFYRSRDYRRWSDCRKVKGRRCIYGQRIFMGWRQQELMSRLSSRVSEECYYMLAEISKLFGDGKMTLEEYVFSLKEKVGINNFVEAVALGKGKKDLTGTALESTKANPSLPVRSEVPIGKACSSLATTEIVKLLTGNFRLSKARSNDLFWEAIWPRLLARGWHSEQPSDVVYAGTKQSLVFLVPGVKKFSRRLEKGIHFFDSVADVLQKVASSPSLLELEVNPDDGGSLNGKCSTGPEIGEDPDVSLNPRRHSYLQPRSSTQKHNYMTFTVVDTSLYTGEGIVRVRELRSLPIVPLSFTPCGPRSEESSSDSVEGGSVEPYYGQPNDGFDVLSNQLSNGLVSVVMEEVSTLDTQLPDISCSKNYKEEQSSCDKNANVCQVSSQTMDVQSSHEVKLHEMSNLSSITNYKESSHNSQSTVIDELLNRGEIGHSSFVVGLSQSSLSGSSAACDSEKSSERNPIKNTHGPAQSVDNSSVIPDKQFIKNVLHKCDNIVPGAKPFSTSEGVAITANQSAIASRRQSTRNRPSAKVLEAFAYGFLGTSNKRKGGNGSTATASRRVRRKNKDSFPLETVAADNSNFVCHKQANMDVTHNENLEMLGKSDNFVVHEFQVMQSDMLAE
ncbi:unnamed protein product [Cuscuta europaea]|uniref:SANT domain-containing protein n=1 Tax=Cuscuta europaea TaxID=41803 RepID=A0A9P0YZL0_CUSEU|nr:unnamed protein product [Cuscuta europaea]